MSPRGNNKSQLSVCPTITNALEIIHDIKDNNFPSHVNVLFTGSLHLVGSTLAALKSVKEEKVNETLTAKRLRT